MTTPRSGLDAHLARDDKRAMSAAADASWGQAEELAELEAFVHVDRLTRELTETERTALAYELRTRCLRHAAVAIAEEARSLMGATGPRSVGEARCR